MKHLVGSSVAADSLDVVAVEHPAKVERYMARPGDVLVAARGTQPKVAVVPATLAGAVVTSTLIGVRPHDELLPEALLAFLSSPRGRAALLARVRSSTGLLALSPRDVEEVEVPVPPLHRQRRIAAIIRAGEEQYAVAVEAARLRRRVAYQVAAHLLSREGREGGRSDE